MRNVYKVNVVMQLPFNGKNNPKYNLERLVIADDKTKAEAKAMSILYKEIATQVGNEYFTYSVAVKSELVLQNVISA